MNIYPTYSRHPMAMQTCACIKFFVGVLSLHIFFHILQKFSVSRGITLTALKMSAFLMNSPVLALLLSLPLVEQWRWKLRQFPLKAHLCLDIASCLLQPLRSQNAVSALKSVTRHALTLTKINITCNRNVIDIGKFIFYYRICFGHFTIL